MGRFVAKQPNGLLCVFSTITDCPIAYDLTERDYIEFQAEEARERAADTIKNHLYDFKYVTEYYRPSRDMPKKSFEKFLKEVCKVRLKIKKEKIMIRDYRGKTVDGKWIVGSLMNEEEEDVYIKQGDKPMQKVDLDSVGQWTGLYDSKGARIFTGDVLDEPEPTIHKYLAKFCDYQGAYVLFYNLPRDPKLYHIMLNQWSIESRKLSIVGNETDNPDLWLREQEEE